MDAGVDLRLHPPDVEVELGADLDHRLPRESRLVGVERVVVLPEAALGGGGLAGLRRQRRQRMALGNRQVAEAEEEPIAEPIADAAEDRLRPEAVGALEVAEHHQLQRRPPLAANVVDVLQRG